MINQSSVYEGFRLLRSLGQGWLGEVYAAQDLDSATTVALRVLAPEHLAQPQLLVQFGRLFEKVRRVKHPGILELGRFVEGEGRAYYTMTLAQSGSVRQLLQGAVREGQYLDLLTVVDLVRQAAAALEFAHQADLMHGTLTPENLLLQPARALMGRPGYTVQLSDFGVGELRAYTYGTHDRLIVTTPAYMSPEQCRGVRGERRSDVYALGVILYELLTGLVPFETRDLADALQKHQHVAPIPPGQVRRDIPEELEEVVLTCLAKAPEYRYAGAGELEVALQGVLNRLMPQGPNPTVVLPQLTEPSAPRPPLLADRSSELRLLILDAGGELLRAEVLTEQTTTLGRSAKNTVVLEHPGISRHHLNVEQEGEKVFVTDLSSTNGSALSGIKLPPMKRVPWALESVLHVGPYWLALVPPYKAAPQARIGVSTDVTALSLVPGVAQSLRVHLANTGRTVDHFMVSVEGVPPEWVRNAFHEIQLNPGMRGDTTLQLLVPRESASLAGEYPARVIARSRENPGEVGAVPMTWQVASFTETTVEVTPRKRTAWFRTRYELTIKNGGNLPLTYNAKIRDDEGAVRLQTPLSMLRVPQHGDLSQAVPWHAMLATWWVQLREGLGKVRVAPLRQNVLVAPGQSFGEPIRVKLPARWIGTARHHNLQLGVTSDHDKPTPVSVALQQNPVLPLWWIPFLLALGAVAFFWFNRPPTIVDVNVTPEHPGVGQPFTVTWETHGAGRVKLQPLNRELPPGPDGKGQFTLTAGVSAPTELKLTAYNRFKSAQRTVTVTPQLPAPNIARFEVSSTAVPVGKTITVRWKVANVKNITLEPFGTVDAQGERQVQVTTDTHFRLSATAGGESVTRNVDVKVLAPVVQLFKVSPEKAEPGQTVTLRWKVANATTVTIDPIGTVAPSGQTQVTAQQGVTYRITAGNGQTTVTSTGAVNVVARPPKVVAFEVQPRKVRPGDNYTLTWQTQDAATVELMGPTGLQTVAQSGSLTQTAPAVAAPVTLTLSARNEQGQQVDAAASLVVLPPAPQPKPEVAQQPAPPKPETPPLPPAQIKLFTVSAGQVVRGRSVTLKWQVANAEQVRLKPLDRVLPPSGSLTVPVQQDTTFVLSADNGQVSMGQMVRVLGLQPKVSVKPAVTPKPPVVRKPSAPAKPLVAQKPQTPQKQQPAQKSPATPDDTPPAPPATPASTMSIASFLASDSKVMPGSTVVLTWNVKHPGQVTLDGTEVDAQGSRTVTVDRTTTYVLQAEDPAGKVLTRTLRVNVQRPTKAVQERENLPGATGLSGYWQHSFGKLSLQIDGTDVSGTFINDRTGDQGQIKGKLIRSNSTGSFTLNAQVSLQGKPDENIAFVIAFNENLTTFFGPYSSRAARERWCGWRPGTPPPAECGQN